MTDQEKEKMMKDIKLSIEYAENSQGDSNLKNALAHLQIALKDLTNIVYKEGMEREREHKQWHDEGRA